MYARETSPEDTGQRDQIHEKQWIGGHRHSVLGYQQQSVQQEEDERDDAECQGCGVVSKNAVSQKRKSGSESDKDQYVVERSDEPQALCDAGRCGGRIIPASRGGKSRGCRETA